MGANFEAIVSDYQMPDMDGIEFLKEVRRKDKTPFILFTGKGREEVAIEAINSGADFYIKKGGEPLSQYSELSNAIKQVIARRQAEQRHIESQERYRSLYNHVLGMVYTHDLDGKMLDANPTALKAIGYTYEELLGMNITDLITPEQVSLAMANFHEVLKTGTQVHFEEYRLRRKDGTYLDIETSGSLLYRNGQPTPFREWPGTSLNGRSPAGRWRRARSGSSRSLRALENGYGRSIPTGSSLIAVP